MADEATSKTEGVALLEKCPKEQAEKFVHQILDGICDGKEPRYVDYGKIWTTEQWQSVRRGLHVTLKNFICKDFGKDEIFKELDQYSLSPDIKQVVFGCILARKDEIRAALVSNTAGITNAYLKDFDWKVKMVLASDKIAGIRKSVVSVDLDIQQDNTVRPVTVEMTKEELGNLITSLEAANKMVVQLKA
ncbi:COMM domain-containing protein 8-like [Actinia tenebrosa]|uniref:COMM domain-containing protein 8-like n=1 Tax=Actinia tenebrosa TaxID=6105 RepID=A0A6P8HL09_ACTTE|nr:COMM domain-containing protein 8-like [Actinia tenebrosa]